MPAPAPPLLHRRLVATVVGLCFAFGVLRAAHFAWTSMLAGMDTRAPLAVLLLMRVAEWLTWAPIVLVVLAIAKRLPLFGARPGQALLAHASAFVLLQPPRALLTLLLGSVWPALSSPVGFAEAIRTTDVTLMLATIAFPDFTIYCLVVAAVTALDTYRRHAQQREDLVRAEREATRARLHALEAQLNPHFLFNALNAISAYVERQPSAARALMADLADVLRFTLDHTQGEEVSVAEELAMLERYLSLERSRFGPQLATDVQVAPDTLDLRLPALLLQPLVENAIRHGLRARRGPGRVNIHVWREGDRLMLRVDDDGAGLPAGWDLGGPLGVGLGTTRERLALLYGDAHALRVEPRAGGGTRVEVVLPVLGPSGGQGEAAHDAPPSRRLVHASEALVTPGRGS